MRNPISWFKGKLKQREVRKLKPDENFEFDKNYYGESDAIDGFKFLYCNNFTDRLYSSHKEKLSFISCVITLPSEQKTIKDLEYFVNEVLNSGIDRNNTFNYKSVYMVIGLENIQLFLRGNLNFYRNICETIHNNIFTKYIRNNIFPNDLNIETPNEYLDNIYNSITNPNKEIDILFIENNIECEKFKPIIGLSMKPNSMNVNDRKYLILNGRVVTYLEADNLTDEEIDFIANNVKHGDKLLNVLHKSIIKGSEYSDIDEIIEE